MKTVRDRGETLGHRGRNFIPPLRETGGEKGTEYSCIPLCTPEQIVSRHPEIPPGVFCGRRQQPIPLDPSSSRTTTINNEYFRTGGTTRVRPAPIGQDLTRPSVYLKEKKKKKKILLEFFGPRDSGVSVDYGERVIGPISTPTVKDVDPGTHKNPLLRTTVVDMSGNGQLFYTDTPGNRGSQVVGDVTLPFSMSRILSTEDSRPLISEFESQTSA